MKNSKKGCYYFVLLLGFVVFSSCYETKKQQLENEKQELLNLIETYDAIPFVDEWNGKKIPREFEVKKFPIPINLQLMDKFQFPMMYDKSPLYTFIIYMQNRTNENKNEYETYKKFFKNPENELQSYKDYLASNNIKQSINRLLYCIGEVKQGRYTALILQNHVPVKNDTLKIIYEYAFFYKDNGRYYAAGFNEIQTDEKLKEFEIETTYKMIHDDQSFYQFFSK
ncbi:MAG: hypothetical protein LBJ67_18030 [Planctomycetaceae bacterium]|jgi:hypothetical protein|nr:hypothetical protein [Planctomycetaceae bacterium]